MTPHIGVTVKNNFGKLPAAVEKQLSVALRKAAFEVEAEAKKRVPVDTGAARASIYVSVKGTGNYANRAAEAKSRNGNVKMMQQILPDVPLEAVIGVGVEYGMVLELGGHGQPPRPYLAPAVAHVKPSFEAACAQALKDAT